MSSVEGFDFRKRSQASLSSSLLRPLPPRIHRKGRRCCKIESSESLSWPDESTSCSALIVDARNSLLQGIGGLENASNNCRCARMESRSAAGTWSRSSRIAKEHSVAEEIARKYIVAPDVHAPLLLAF
jgi:hypothetical protein